MKKIFSLMAILLLPPALQGQTGIGVNQLGYLPESVKVAVMISAQPVEIKEFSLVNSETGQTAKTFRKPMATGRFDRFESTYRLDFSDFTTIGTWKIRAGETESPPFRIGTDVYEGTADYLLNYMRQQRCGYNPVLKDSCHTHDGYLVYAGKRDSVHVDVTGGWHDASDYLRYSATSATAVFQMLFAYQQHPEVFEDHFDVSGAPGGNGIPDILDEARWGLDWLVKMNPGPDEMYNQVADDRDHQKMRLPGDDSVSYGKEMERPVYVCTGEPQGLFQYQNRTTGIASTAGKFASAFALGAMMLEQQDPDFSRMLMHLAIDAYQYGAENSGVCQTAPGKAPYFYEEENWNDDMELAATQLYRISHQHYLINQAADFGRAEPTVPWMGADTARHYQWYPFVNLGHYFLARDGADSIQVEFTANLKKGIEAVRERGITNPYRNGVPWIWCSNNYVSAMLTQIRLYDRLTGDHQFAEMEAGLRDWLFGCNPWGTSMIVGLPESGDYPEDTHSAISWLNIQEPWGGLVDGPVYGSIYNSLRGIYLGQPDEYADFQPEGVVYHDDFADYSTNEPTLDGTASLIYYLAAMNPGPDPSDQATPIFMAGDAGYACFRIPAIVKSAKGTLLAFAEARKTGCSDTGNIDLVLRRSTDGGKTWGPLRVIWDAGEAVAGNPAPVVDQNTGTIWLLSTWNLGTDHESRIIDGTSTDTRRIFIMNSDDDGRSWSAAREITDEVKQPDWTWYATGPVHGIQLQKKPYKGRLVIPCDHIEAGTKKYYSHTIFSDDHGLTWKLGGTTPQDQVNECTVAELPDGRLMLNMRNYDRKQKNRKISLSDDGGESWSDIRDDTRLIEPICQAALLDIPGKRKKSALYFLNPADSLSRVNLTLKRSNDQGKNWETVRVIHKGPAAYSDLVQVDPARIGCLYEAGEKSAYEGIWFKLVVR